MSASGGSFVRPRLLTVAPAAVVDQLSVLMGGAIVSERPATSGFTQSVASFIEFASGRSVFVKAGRDADGTADAVRTGARLAATIGDLGPPLIALIEAAAEGEIGAESWAAAVYEVVRGEAIEQWRDEDIPQLADVSARLRDRLDPSPIADTEPYAEAFVPLLGAWSALARRAPVAEVDTVAHVRGLDVAHGLRVETLAELEEHWFAALGSGTALQHGDIRRDNVVREPSGRLWLVDWTHRWTAPGWADWVRLAPDVAASGFDPERVLRDSAWPDADDHAVNAMLAGLAGRCWRDGHLPDVSGLPQLRSMQREQGDMTLRWLARRLGG